MDWEDSQTSKPEAERRRYRRVRLVTEVHCEVWERDEIMVSRNVSLGGMFIDTRFPLPVDSEVPLTFRVYPTEPALTCRSKVVFSRVGMGMGIQFLDLGAGERRTLQKFMEEVA